MDKTLTLFAGAIIVVLLVAAGLSGAFNSLLSFAQGCPPIPTSIYSGAYFDGNNPNAAGLNVLSCKTIYRNNSIAQIGEVYQIQYETGFVSPIGTQESATYGLFLATESDYVATANKANSANLTASQSASASASVNATNAGSSGGGFTAQKWNAVASAERSISAILTSVGPYNNAVSGSSTTTTISGTGSSQAPPSSSPPTFSFTVLITSIDTWFTTLFANAVAYFNTPVNLFNIALSGVSSTNTTYPGNPVTATVSLTLNASQTSTAYKVGSSFAQSTQCSSFVYSNQTKQYVYQSSVVNQTTTKYTNTFTYTPMSVGVYDFGAACQSSNSTFASGAWSSWSALKVVAIQQVGIAVLHPNASTTSPTTSVTISNTNFYSTSGLTGAVSSFINGIVSFFTNLFKNL
jgi:hypothetical protein